MLRKRTIQTNAAKDSVRVSPSFGDPGALSGALAGGSFVGGVAGAMALADSPYPRPGSEPAEIRRYFRGNSGAARLSVVGQLISAASLARFTASAARLAERSGRGSRGLQATALVGGGLAAASLATSALLSAALTGGRGEQDASAVALHKFMFAAGGPVHGVGFGVLIGSLGLAGLRTGELPRPLAQAGLASAAPGSLSPLYFAWKPAAWFTRPGGSRGCWSAASPESGWLAARASVRQAIVGTSTRIPASLRQRRKHGPGNQQRRASQQRERVQVGGLPIRRRGCLVLPFRHGPR